MRSGDDNHSARLKKIPTRRGRVVLGGVALAAAAAFSAVPTAPSQAQDPPAASATDKPNILVIWGDDIGVWNLSAYNRGVMGYRTPNIDRISNEGALFTDHYAQASCTAGRAAFITGQLPIRTGMTTVGLPGDTLGLQKEDATLAEVLKTVGYATGQFGKNHLGDRNEYLPTVHGFDEFLGNLYHLNVSEEAEDVDYPKDDPEFVAKYTPRGVLHSYATDVDDPTEDPRFGKVGRQRIEDTGALTRKRMETVDREFIDASFAFIDKAQAEGEPFFVWLNASRMHVFTHTPQKYLDACMAYTSGADQHCAGMLQHDEEVGLVLQKLDDMGIADNTIVIYSTDNGPEHSTWPYGATTPYRSEKMTTWEGGFRVPMLVRWPGHIAARSELNGIQSHEDVFVTLAAAAGVGDIKERLLAGDNLGTDVTHNGYIDGVNNLDYWTGASSASARDSFIYYAESHLQAVRWRNWKQLFATRDGYYGATTHLEIPWFFNIRQDPFESYDQAPGPRAEISQRHDWVGYKAMDLVKAHLLTLKQHPPRQAATSLSVDQMIESLTRTSQQR